MAKNYKRTSRLWTYHLGKPAKQNFHAVPQVESLQLSFIEPQRAGTGENEGRKEKSVSR